MDKCELKLYKEAILDLGRAIAIDSNLAVAYNKRGYDYFKLGELDLAISDYNKAKK